MDILPKDEGKPYVHQDWPQWATGPNGEGQSFDTAEDVPAGWSVGGKTKGGAKPDPVNTENNRAAAVDNAGPAIPPTNNGQDGSESAGAETDAAGVAWNPDLHAATKNKTKAGLWRMKVGVTRPEGQGEPKTLDL